MDRPSLEASDPGGSASPLTVDAELDPGSYGDADSTFGDAASAYTTSVSSSVFDYVYENGRRYHSYRHGQYVLPNDESEQERLDLVHHIFLLAAGGEIHFAPLVNPQKVLDLGTGTGIWAIEFADQYPEAEICGIDLSPIQPSFVPPNCRFIIDDIEATWPYPEDEKFDYIHLRCMCGSISDWSKLLGQIYQCLKPGGWLEFQEFEAWLFSDDASIETATAVMTWQQYLDEASTKFGKRLNVATEIAGYVSDVGFSNVEEKVLKIPMGPWPKSPRQKTLGHYQLVNMLEGVEPLSLALFTRVLGQSNEEVQALLAQVRAELNNSNIHLYGRHRYILGQKPSNP